MKILIGLLIIMCLVGIAGGLAFTILAFSGYFNPLVGG